MQLKLMLVDDHLLLMEGLQYLLETNGFQVIGKARNGREAVIKARVLYPDMILMDIRMPEYDGLDALRHIKAEMPDIKIIMLTTSEEDADLFNAFKYGASGYLLKNTDAKELINTIEQTYHNEASFSPELAVKLIDEFKLYGDNVIKDIPSPLTNVDQTQLTERQLEILMMVAEGRTYKEIGESLGIKERTIKYHMGKMLECLHLENRSQIIAYVSKNGMIE